MAYKKIKPPYKTDKRLFIFTLLCLLGLGARTTAQEADSEIYAVLSGSTLTFYYDRQMTSRGGTQYWNDEPMVIWDNKIHDAVTKVVFDPSMEEARPASTKYWFLYFHNLTEIADIRYLHTDECTQMIEIFNGCYALESVDVSRFNTKNVTYMSGMFQNCKSLRNSSHVRHS